MNRPSRQKFFGKWRAVPPWAETLAGVGIISEGVVYLLLGVVALGDAWQKTSEDSNAVGMMRVLGHSSLGSLGLGLLAAGMCCYGIHRGLEAFFGPVQTRSRFFEAMYRLGRVVSGLVFLGLAGLAIRVLFSHGQNSEDERIRPMAAGLMRHPLGNVALVIIGSVIGLVGVKYAYDAISGRYRSSYDLHSRSAGWRWSVKIGASYGIFARAFLFLLCGGMICYSGLTNDSSSAGGMRGAVALIQKMPFGQWWFSFLAFGLISYGLFCLVRSVYGVYGSDAGV